MSHDFYAFNTGATLNPTGDNEYHEAAESTALVLVKTDRWTGQDGKTGIILTGWGFGGTGYASVGDVIDLVADQTGRRMGAYRVLGINEGGIMTGHVPDRKRKHYVMK